MKLLMPSPSRYVRRQIATATSANSPATAQASSAA
jgi:hypothetical protein